jgi:hypothetical protein
LLRLFSQLDESAHASACSIELFDSHQVSVVTSPSDAFATVALGIHFQEDQHMQRHTRERPLGQAMAPRACHITRNAGTAKPKIAPTALNGRGGAPKSSTGIQLAQRARS